MFEKINGKAEETAIKEELMNPSENHSEKMNALVGKYFLKRVVLGAAIGASIGIGIAAVANAIAANLEDETEEVVEEID